MKIAMYQPWIYLYGGLERSILELIKHSRHEWTVYTGYYNPETTFPDFRHIDVRELGPLSVRRDIASVLSVGIKIFCQKIPLEHYDAIVVWCDGMGDMSVFRNHSLPLFNICSTPLRAAFDPVYEKNAFKSRGIFGRIAYKAFKQLFKCVDRMAWQHYDGVIATSVEVRERIIKGKLYKNGSKMKLLHPGIDWHAYDESPVYEPYFLVPGRIMWTKNIELAIQAFQKAQLPENWKLIIAGFLDEKSRPYISSLKDIVNKNERILFEPSPSDTRLNELYQRAGAILFPPLNEDWGIVPLEAMANSKPVIANAAGGPLESIKNQETGWLLNPDPDEWANILQWISCHENDVKKMGIAARKHAEKFDWRVFASGIDDALEQWCYPLKHTDSQTLPHTLSVL